MWGNLGLNVGNLVDAVQRISKDIEQTMDDAVGATPAANSSCPNDIAAVSDLGAISNPSNLLKDPAISSSEDPSMAVLPGTQDAAARPPLDPDAESGHLERAAPAAIAAPVSTSVVEKPHLDENIVHDQKAEPTPVARKQKTKKSGVGSAPTAVSGASSDTSFVTMSSILNPIDIKPVKQVSVVSTSTSTVDHVSTALEETAGAETRDPRTAEILNIVKTNANVCQTEVETAIASSDSSTLVGIDMIRAGETIRTLQAELVKARSECSALTEQLKSRERTLESVNTQMAELNSQLEEKNSFVQRTAEENMSLTMRLSAAAGMSTSADSDLKKQIGKLSEDLREKTSRLESFEIEGQALAKKQGELEKLVRKAKSDMREKDAELSKLKEGREQLVKTIEEMQEIIRKHDADSSNASKSMSAMQAVSQASMERLAKLEADLSLKTEELVQQKRALDASWTENADLKRAISDLRAQREDAKSYSDDAVRRISDLESQLRDIEQREAVLRATNKQLQENVQRHAADSALREDRLRDEVADARKRWQDAISTRESMATEISQATGPLLRQISNLQESVKFKSESWQAIESSLLERAIKAEGLAETAMYKSKAFEEQNVALRKQLDSTNSKLHDKDLLVQSLEMTCDRLTRSEKEQSNRVAELETRLSTESTQRLNAQSALRELESRLKNEMRESKEALEVANKQNQIRTSVLTSEVEYLKDQLNAAKTNAASFGQSNEMVQYSANLSPQSPKFNKIPSGLLPNGDISFAAANQMSQRVEQREIELRELTAQLSQLQIARDALLQEVSFMSARNSDLEEQLSSISSNERVLQRLETENGVLLALLGEKEEEVQALAADVRDIKGLYRSELDSLYSRVEELSKRAV